MISISVLFTLLCLSCSKSKTSPPPSEQLTMPTPDNEQVILTQLAQLSSYANQTVQVEGQAIRMKAGSAIQLIGGRVWCTNIDWSTEANQIVRATGTLSTGTSPMANFPVATQDENGNWSQGVGGPITLLEQTDPLGAPTEPAAPSNNTEHTPIPADTHTPTTPSSWKLTVNSHEIIEQ